MNSLHRGGLLSLVLLLGSLAPLCAQPADERLQVIGTGGARLIPISLGGFNGVAYEVLRFDLEVAGCKIVSSNAATHHVSGSNDSVLRGTLTATGSPTPLLTRAYSGPMRALAHAFADEIIEKLTGRRGIAQTRIAFKANFGRHKEVFISDYDGANAVQVTRDTQIIATPAWSPDHRQLFYTSYMSGFPFIYSHTLATGARAAVSRQAGYNGSPAVSPDGRHLAMTLSYKGTLEVYVADTNGGNLRQVTFTKAGAASPCWSPDSQWICYTSNEAGPARLYKVRSSGGASQQLATVGADTTTEPDWSPDGKTIVFTSQNRGFKIFTVPASGGDAEFVCEGEFPSWAANSRTVVFARRRTDQSYRLQLVDVPTRQVKDIPLKLGDVSEPAWAR